MNQSSKNIKASVFLLLTVASSLTLVHANSGKSWISSDFPENNAAYSAVKQAERWATCAATLNTYANIVETVMKKPATATQIRNIGNGAKTSILGTFLIDFIENKDSISDEVFAEGISKRMNYAVNASESYVDSKINWIEMKRENSDEINWVNNLLASVSDCIQPEVREIQQMHIDIMREVFLDVK